MSFKLPIGVATMESMLESISHLIINVISTLGYPGIVLTMAIESALIPLPSEVIMPFSGFLASTGQFSLVLVIISGAVGNVIGSLIAYAIGYYGHEKLVRKFVVKWGRWILLSEKELDNAEKMLNKYGSLIVFTSRLLPGVRTVISLPCGFAKLPIKKFIVLTFLGSLFWAFILTEIGFALGENWDKIGPFFHKADLFIILLILALVAYYINHRLKVKRSKIA